MSPSIADILSATEANQLIASKVAVGSVYIANFSPSEGITPKNGERDRNKMFVVLGEDDSNVYGCALINSDINKNQLSCEAQAVQYPILGRKYNGAFTNDFSFVNCAQIHPVKKSKMTEGRFVCALDKDDIEFVFDSVRNNGLNSIAELRRYQII